MKLSFEYKEKRIDYNLIYKKIRAISINIGGGGEVNVSAPLGTSLATVMDKVKGHAPWILTELNSQLRARQKEEISEDVVYLGKHYGVEIIKDDDTVPMEVKLIKGKFVIRTYTENQKLIKKALVMWYQKKLHIKIKERLQLYGELFKEVPKEIIIEEEEDLLFEINNHKLFVNVMIGTVPVSVIDYLLVRGLCKLNSVAEKGNELAKLKEILPNYEQDKEWLEKNKGSLLL
ncbi:MAG: hypothetical protein K0R69_2144 [Clostridia bacterium]|jgi:predicted metal-dependent hydrolase|nr:hypothetical protein [Clostridia bacterium]